MSKMNVVVLMTVGTMLLSNVVSFRMFQDRIPNGNRVPHPCLDNFLWLGLGHKNAEGAGARNPFGEDFDRNGKVWNKCLCERDSDGDGKTNGEELGDPDCVWTEGDLPKRVDGITHPGICEPLDDPICQEKNDWEFCAPEEFICDAINEPDVEEIRLQFPMTDVPPTETNYFCMTFDLPIPSNQSYHMIASKPQLNNTLVSHHILVFGCNDPQPRDDPVNIPEPTLCGMDANNCPDIIALWAVGSPGGCFSDEYGFKVGQGGYKKVMMQIHWNNPELRSDYKDAPGMSLYVTPNLREHDGGVLQIGTLDISIPPRADAYTVNGNCRSECTRDLPFDIKLDSVILHMHYLGIESGFKHTRDGNLINLIYEEHYSYDRPETYRFEEPVTFKAGDELSISCKYQSKTKDKVTSYGDGTADEMCYAFVTYYPVLPVPAYCLSFKSLSVCPAVGYGLSDCDYDEFFNTTTSAARFGTMYNLLNTSCNVTGASPESCPEGCAETVERIRAENPCLQGDTGEIVETQIFTTDPFLTSILQLMHICDPDWDPVLLMPRTYPDEDNTTKNRTTVPTPRDGDGECVFDREPPGSAGQKAVVHCLSVLLVFVTAILMG